MTTSGQAFISYKGDIALWRGSFCIIIQNFFYHVKGRCTCSLLLEHESAGLVFGQKFLYRGAGIRRSFKPDAHDELPVSGIFALH